MLRHLLLLDRLPNLVGLRLRLHHEPAATLAEREQTCAAGRCWRVRCWAPGQCDAAQRAQEGRNATAGTRRGGWRGRGGPFLRRRGEPCGMLPPRPWPCAPLSPAAVSCASLPLCQAFRPCHDCHRSPCPAAESDRGERGNSVAARSGTQQGSWQLLALLIRTRTRRERLTSC